MLAPGTRWTLNSRVALGIRHIDFILWLWKLILKDNPEKPTLFSPLALDRKKKKNHWKRKANQCSVPTCLHSLQIQPTKSSLRTEHSGKESIWEEREESVLRGLLAHWCII